MSDQAGPPVSGELDATADVVEQAAAEAAGLGDVTDGVAELHGSHTLTLANGETVQTDSPCATHHYGADGELYAIVRRSETREE